MADYPPRLADLTPALRTRVDGFLARAKAEGIALRIVCVLRSTKEQRDALRAGTSQTMRSKHLPGPDGKSRAIDVCPVELLATKGWSPMSPLWWRLGKIGEECGMRWGGRWKTLLDLTHFELIEGPQEAAQAERERKTGRQYK